MVLGEFERPDLSCHSEIEKFGNKKMMKELIKLEEVNTKVREKCNFILAENNDLPRDKKMWGVAEMVGYQASGEYCMKTITFSGSY